MAFSPQSHTFSFTKNIPQTLYPVTVEFNLGNLPKTPHSPEILGVPNWAKISNIAVVDGLEKKITFEVSINTLVANALPLATYIADLKVRFVYTFVKLTPDITFRVSLKVEEATLLTLTPSILVFNYVNGQALPQDKLMGIATDYNWTATPEHSWVKINSNPSGLGNASVIIGADPTGLPVGTHESKIQVTDGHYTRYMPVKLIITGLENETDFLSITPESLAFVSENTVENTAIKTVALESSGSWTTEITGSWLNLDVESGNSGVFNLEISVSSLDIGNGFFSGNIKFINGDLFKTLNVSLQVIDNFVIGIISENLYYAKDRNKLKVSSAQENTQLQLQTTVSNGTDNFNYTQKAPYFKGLSEIVIGEETEFLQKTFIPTRGHSTRVQTRISPLNYAINAINVNTNDFSETPISAYANVLFLKGNTPSQPNKLCYIPENITVTNTAFIRLSLLAEAAPDIVITGAVETFFSASLPNKLCVYNAIINLSELNVQPGNTITITFGSLVVNVTIKNKEPEVNTIAFLNEWNDYEYFETTGFLTIAPTATQKTTKIAVEGKDHTKVVDIDLNTEYTLNTGHIYTQEEVNWLAKILENKRFFLYVEGEDFVEMELITKSLQRYQTRNHIHAYQLKFKKAIV